jgi:ribosomal-protein-alanine N-acetyltransferase
LNHGHLTPQLGRLIDEAKAAAARAADAKSGTVEKGTGRSQPSEGVALLLADGSMRVAPGGASGAGQEPAMAALAEVQQIGGGEISAAAVAVANDRAETANPCPRTRSALASVDPDLPLVVKQQGRWVLVSLSNLPPVAPQMYVSRVRCPSHDLLATLQAYDFEAFGPAGLRTYDLAVMAEAGAVYMARLADDIVGGCQLLRVLDSPGFFYVVGFYIRPGWQRLGLGRALLEAVAAESRALGADGLVLTVAPDNQRAIKLYESAGFVSERFIPDFYGKGQDRYILRWQFAPGDLQASV